MEENLEEYTDLAVEMGMAYAPKVLLAIATLVIGFWIINKVLSGIDRLMEARKTEPTLQKFLHSLLSIMFKALLLISAASMIGIETTSFIAILGAAGLAVGLALQGSLANFAGGVLILLFKPFKVGDAIEGAGVLGIVREIQIFNTIMTTFDNKRIIVPNGELSNNVITNFSAEPTRRVDMIFGIGYGDDVLKAKEVLKELVAGDERVLKEPAFEVHVKELGDSSVNFVVRAWVNAADYWPFFFSMQERVKLRFDEDDITIPFPQRDVHLYQHGSA
ncbi:MAG: mechanosensitive ion channel [Ketobacteraceae bacterium]|nr:mechanosensitive ion channel [Ketobacteraceae bacterium]